MGGAFDFRAYGVHASSVRFVFGGEVQKTIGSISLVMFAHIPGESFALCPFHYV